jgi:steroid 5-alpha reductase family enzyme
MLERLKKEPHLNQENKTASAESGPNRNPIWLTGIVVSILLGALIAWLGSSGSDQFGQIPVFALIIGWAYLVNWLVFFPSFIFHTEKYFDLTGAVTYITATLAAIALSKELDFRAWLATVLVIVWSGRLGMFLYLRIQRDGHDVRFDQMKHDFWQFFMTWTIQGLWVSLTASTAFVIITSKVDVEFGWIGILGLLIWLTGFSIEVIADYQKSRFKKDPANQGRFISTGLWALCRHPNYFGEILLWTGMLIITMPVLGGSRWFAVVSPLFVYFLLTRVSGIPMLQKRANDRWGDNQAYQDYLKNTPKLIPWPSFPKKSS